MTRPPAVIGVWLALLMTLWGPARVAADCAAADTCIDKIAVADAPLYLIKGAAPNLLLSLDDSESMLWASYETDYSTDVRDLSSKTNPLYYDPEVVYLPPMKPDGTSYPSAHFTAAPRDFFLKEFCADCRSKLTGALSHKDCADLCLSASDCTLNLETHYAAVHTDAAAPCTVPSYDETSSAWPIPLPGNYVLDPDYLTLRRAVSSANRPRDGQEWAALCMYDQVRGRSTPLARHPVDCPAIYMRMKVRMPDGSEVKFTDVDGVEKPCADHIPIDRTERNPDDGLPDDLPDWIGNEETGWNVRCLERVEVGDDDTDIAPTSAATLQRRRDLLPDCGHGTDRQLAKCNFANWYTFYRSRWRSLQTTLTRVMDTLDPTVRVAYQSFSSANTVDFNHTDPDTYPVSFKDQLLTPFGAYSANRREWFQNWLFSSQAAGGTPAINAALQAINFYGTAEAYLQNPQVGRNDEANPLLGCRNNFQLLFTDGAWDPPTASILLNTVGNSDGQATDLPANSDAETYAGSLDITSYPVSGPLTRIYRDANAKSLADVVFYSWIHDLRPLDNPSDNALVSTLIANPSYTNSTAEIFWNPENDPADWQHITTYTVGFGLQGKVVAVSDKTKQGVYTVDGSQMNIVDDGFPTWNPSEGTDSRDRFDDLWHAGINGRGGYFPAKDPESLIASFANVMDAVSKVAANSAAAAPAVNSGSVGTTRFAYQATFKSDNWTGDLRAYQLSGGPNAAPCAEKQRPKGAVCEDEGDYHWSAADQLDGNSSRAITGVNWTRRVVATGTRVETTEGAVTAVTHSGLAFGDLGALSRDDQTVLLASVTDAAEAAAVMNFIKGDRQYEGLRRESSAHYTFRDRDSLIGDIINGAPVAVSAPYRVYNDSTYATWASANKNRTEIVYVGANDGMLHAFDAGRATDATAGGTGKELFAYVPRPLLGKLKRLTAPGYGSNPPHTNFVDGPMADGDVQIGTVWTSVVIGGMGLGAQGIYAIRSPNVTSAAPDIDPASIHLWDFTDQDALTGQGDRDMGYIFGKPAIVRVVMDGGAVKWAAVFGNGLNSSEADGRRPTNCGTESETACGQAVLYVVDIATGQLITKFSTTIGREDDPIHAGTAEDPKEPNGLSQPTVIAQVVADQDGQPVAAGNPVATLAYAGDLFGNLWRFNLAALVQGQDRQPDRIFITKEPTAEGQSATVQPITAPVVVAPHPTGVGNLILFGTGRYLDFADVNDMSVQTFYGIWDRVPAGSGLTSPMDSDFLQPQYFKETDIAVESVSFGRTSTRATIKWAIDPLHPNADTGESVGWRIDLGVPAGKTPAEIELAARNKDELTIAPTGERVVVAPIVMGERVLFVSMVPGADQCTGGGYSWLNALDYGDGSAPDYRSFDYTLDGTFDEADLLDTASADNQVGTSIRFANGDVLAGAVASQGGLLVSGDPPKQLQGPSARRWRVWQQTP